MSITVTDEIVEKEARRIKRYSLSLPTRVEVRVDSKFTWNEITRVEDVSAYGAGFTLKRPIKRGRLAVISLPMPKQLRCFDYHEPQYRIWGLVRRCIPLTSNPGAAAYAIGVAFVGKNPPPSYFDNPSKLYELAKQEDKGMWTLIEAPPQPDESELPSYLRRHTRFAIPEPLILELLDENGDVAAGEVSVTENLSISGAAVFTSFDVAPGTFIRVRSDVHNISIISVVRGKHIGADGISRLHIEFIDHFFPLKGVE